MYVNKPWSPMNFNHLEGFVVIASFSHYFYFTLHHDAFVVMHLTSICPLYIYYIYFFIAYILTYLSAHTTASGLDGFKK